MSTSMDTQINWLKKDIKDQVDVGIEEFSVVESGEGKLLEFVNIVVESTINRLKVSDALDCFYYLQDIGELRPGKDRIVCLNEYFIDWVGLELAKQYA